MEMLSKDQEISRDSRGERSCRGAGVIGGLGTHSCGERREQGVGSGERLGCGKLQFWAVSSWVIKALGEDKHKVTLNVSCCTVCVWYLFLPFPSTYFTSAFRFTILYALSSGVHIQQMRSKLFASLVAFQLFWF